MAVAIEHDTTHETVRRYGRLVADAWLDPALRQRLGHEPAAVLRERGFDLPAGVGVEVVAARPAPDSPAVTYLVIPPEPARLMAEEKPAPKPEPAPPPKRPTRSVACSVSAEPSEGDQDQTETPLQPDEPAGPPRR